MQFCQAFRNRSDSKEKCKRSEFMTGKESLQILKVRTVSPIDDKHNTRGNWQKRPIPVKSLLIARKEKEMRDSESVRRCFKNHDEMKLFARRRYEIKNNNKSTFDKYSTIIKKTDHKWEKVLHRRNNSEYNPTPPWSGPGLIKRHLNTSLMAHFGQIRQVRVFGLSLTIVKWPMGVLGRRQHPRKRKSIRSFDRVLIDISDVRERARAGVTARTAHTV